MNQASTINPALSPAFDRARKLSRVMAVLFTIGFWLTLLGTVLILATPFVPGPGYVGLDGITVSLGGLSFGQRVWVLVAIEMAAVPVVFLMYHAQQVFSHFARGEVFVLPVIAHIRHAGLWLIISFFAYIAGRVVLNVAKLSPGPAHGTAWPLVIGVTTTIAAYVMEEARRIAAENAEIV